MHYVTSTGCIPIIHPWPFDISLCLSELRSCMKVEVAILVSPSLTVLMHGLCGQHLNTKNIFAVQYLNCDVVLVNTVIELVSYRTFIHLSLSLFASMYMYTCMNIYISAGKSVCVCLWVTQRVIWGWVWRGGGGVQTLSLDLHIVLAEVRTPRQKQHGKWESPVNLKCSPKWLNRKCQLWSLSLNKRNILITNNKY